MTEHQNENIPNSTKDTDNPDERTALRERANIMGLKYSPNISNQLLRERIHAHLNNKPDPGEPGAVEDPFEDDSSTVFDEVGVDQVATRLAAAAKEAVNKRPLSKKQLMQKEREKQWAEQLRLVRVRISCLNPQKKDLRGEVISVSNAFVGTVRKFIPFGEATDNGYHIPFILYTELLGRQFQSISSKKMDNNGLVFSPQHRMIKEFAIELLPDLTATELTALARTQTIAANQ